MNPNKFHESQLKFLTMTSVDPSVIRIVKRKLFGDGFPTSIIMMNVEGTDVFESPVGDKT